MGSNTFASYHPATNGAVDRFVQTVKQALRAGLIKQGSCDGTVSSHIPPAVPYRNTPHATTGVAPSQLLSADTPRYLTQFRPSSKQQAVKNKRTTAKACQ